MSDLPTPRCARGRRRPPVGRTAAALALAVLASACSVSTPRDGFTVGAGGQRSGVALAEDDAGVVTDEGGFVDSEVVTDGPVGSGPRATSGARSSTGSTGQASAGTTQTTGRRTGGTTQLGPGVSDDRIVVSLLAGWSGVYGAAAEQFFDQGFVTWQNEVNTNGGIHGRRIAVKKVDTKDTADGGVAACREATGNQSYLVVVWGGLGDAVDAATDCLDKQRVTHLTMAEPKPGWQHAFTSLTSTTDQGRTLATLVKNHLGDGSKKLGVLYVTDPIYVSIKNSYVAEARSLGMDVAATEAVEPNQASFTAQLLRLRDAGVQNLAVIATTEAIGILRDARALSWTPRLVAASWTYDFVTQAARDTASGVYGVKLGVAADSAAYAQFQQKRQKYNPSNTPPFTDAVLAYGYAVLIGRVLDAAGDMPSKESLVTGLESIRAYDNGALPPITYGPGDHIGPRASFPVVCCTPDWNWRGLGAARETF